MKFNLLTPLLALPTLALAQISADGTVRARGPRFRFGADVRVRAQPRSIRSSVETSTSKEFDIRPSNATIDFKTNVGFRLRPAPTLRTMVFNQTGDNNETFGYRVNLLRLAEVEGTTTALNSTNVVNLVQGGGSWTFQSVTDRTVNSTTVKRMQASFTANLNGLNPRARVTLTADFPLAEIRDTDGRRRRPNALKWGLNVTDFPWTSDTSKLAILLSVNSRQSREIGTRADGSTYIAIGGTNGTFTWNSTVYINTAQTPTPLLFTNLGTRDTLRQQGDEFEIRGESATYLQFTVDATGRPSDIWWDPENEVDEDAALGNGAGGLGVGKVMGVTVAVAVAVMTMVI